MLGTRLLATVATYSLRGRCRCSLVVANAYLHRDRMHLNPHRRGLPRAIGALPHPTPPLVTDRAGLGLPIGVGNKSQCARYSKAGTSGQKMRAVWATRAGSPEVRSTGERGRSRVWLAKRGCRLR